ncbi:patatin-like phospholipase family protein [Alteromonas gilva]|uniref:Patatin-like phospholipase family protein n=1 Tax=Alteromonas gilva TaxID=2987522 RepID=A0ABT5L6V3_9ALTE|nr:patatin-like phospholipase family protein [Alteromonas gilva]MDC8831488.1 patatin-like phospholipase family protein [Alteromonas gilva]
MPLDIYAGPSAMRRIEQEGLSPGLFSHILGASGGPKWFVLAGIDRVLFPEFFATSTKPLNVIGSSAGAFRAACFVQQDPAAAINRLADTYSQTVYSAKPSAEEITEKARDLIDNVMGQEGVMDVLTNKRVKLHVIAARCHGLMRHYGKYRQLAGLGLSAAANAMDRRLLQKLYTRSVFSAPDSCLSITDPYRLPTEFIALGYNNVKDALLASGSIPLVLTGVERMVAAPAGMYRDGGIIDYHFDLSFGPDNGLVLYPHFYPQAIPGWFDKRLKRRIPHAASFDNVVMLVPSDEFVASLPYGKIPDRKDFETMDASTRIKYWQRVISESNRLGECFIDIVRRGSIAEVIQPLPFLCKAS